MTSPTSQSDQKLIDGVRLGDADLFAEGLHLGGNVNLFVITADPNVNVEHPYPLLVYVIGRKNLNRRIYELIMEQSVDILAASVNGFTPLMAAAMNLHNDVFDELLARGADKHIKHKVLCTDALFFAAEGGNLPILHRCIYEFGQNPQQIECILGNTTLIEAVDSGQNTEMALLLIEEYGVDPHRANKEGLTVFVAACRHGLLTLVKYLYEVQDVDPHCVKFDSSGSALYNAARNGHIEVVRYLLEVCKVQDINRTYINNYTALNAAALDGHLEVVRYLYDVHHADAHIPNIKGHTPLILACNSGNVELVKYLYEQCQVDPHCVAQGGTTSALYEASLGGHLEVVRYLVQICQVQDVNRKYFGGHTAAVAAASRGHVAVVIFLDLHCAADLSIANVDGNNALMLAAGNGHLAVVRYLCERVGGNVDLNRQDPQGRSAYYMAREAGHREIVRYLSDNLCTAVCAQDLQRVQEILAADPAETSDVTDITNIRYPVRSVTNGEYGKWEMRHPLSIAIQDKAQDIIDALWPRVNFTSLDAALMSEYVQLAVQTCNLTLVQRFFAEPIAAEVVEISNLLFQAVQAGAEDVVCYLQEVRGLQISATDGLGSKEWLFAAARGGRMVVFLQVRAALQGDLTVRDAEGELLLHVACRAGSLELAQLLIIEGRLDVNDEQTTSRESPLCCAVRSGSLPLVRYLLSCGARTDIILSKHSTTVPGASLLHLAAGHNSHEVMEFLLSEVSQAAFDCELRDQAGYTPLHYSSKAGSIGCLQILLSKGVGVNTRSTANYSTFEGGLTALTLAAINGHEAAVTLLLQHNADVNLTCAQGHPALYYAIPTPHEHTFAHDGYTSERCDRAVCIVSLLLARTDLDPNICVNNPRFYDVPLLRSIQLGHTALAALLIEDTRVNVNIPAVIDVPLICAVEEGREEIAALLLHRIDLDVEAQNNLGDNALVIAQRNERHAICELIRTHTSYSAEALIFHYVRENRVEDVRKCLQQQPNLIEIRQAGGGNLFFVACSYNHLGVMQLLVETWREHVKAWVRDRQYAVLQQKVQSKWHVGLRGGIEYTEQYLQIAAVQFAANAKKGPTAVAQMLTAALAKAAPAFASTPEVFRIVEMQHRAMAYLALLTAGTAIDVENYHLHLSNTLEVLFLNEPSDTYSIPLYLTTSFTSENCVECTAYLLSLDNVLVNLEEGVGDSPVLHWLAGDVSNSRTAMLSLFLDCPKVAVNKHSRRQDWNGNSPLTYAIRRGAFENALIMLNRRPECDINYRNCSVEGEKSALILAAEKGSAEIVRCILAFPAVNVNIQDANGFTALFHAALQEHPAVVELLTADPRVDMNLSIEPEKCILLPAGCTALHAAAYGDCERCLELLHRRADLKREPRTRNEQWTPLMLAAVKGFVKAVRWLVDHEADVYAQDKDGLTARLLALSCGRMEIAEILLEKEQKLENVADESKECALTEEIQEKEEEQVQAFRKEQALKEQIAKMQAEFTHELQRLHDELERHVAQVVVLMNDRNLLLAERLILQQKQAAVGYLTGNHLLRAFYNHLQSKLTELFLAYKILASGAISRAETTTDTVAVSAIGLVGGMIPILGDVVSFAAELTYTTARDAYEDAIFAYVSSIFVNISEMTQLIEAAARLTTFKLERQLMKLENTGDAQTLAECVVAYFLAALRGKTLLLSEGQSVYPQLVRCLFTYEPPQNNFVFQNEIELKTDPRHSLPQWTARGVLKESGIATDEGIWFSHPSGDVARYDYRYGSAEEARDLGYLERATGLPLPAHTLSDNPFRCKEKVEKPDIPQVVTWKDFLEDIRNSADFMGCISRLQRCADENCAVVLSFKEGIARSQLLELAGYLGQQSKHVLDMRIGPVTACEVPRQSTTIVLRVDTELSAELLCSRFEEHLLRSLRHDSP